MISVEGSNQMFLWIMAGYCIAAVVFYGYIVATAEPEPKEKTPAVKTETNDEQRIDSQRKAA